MDRQTLRKALCATFPSSGGEVVLRETDKGATLREITVHGLPAEAYAVKLDGIKVHKLFFDKIIGDFNKHGDYLIVTDRDMIVVEMKSQKEISEKLLDECKRKFKSDCCIFDYCDSVFFRILKKNPFFKGKPIYFVLLYQGAPIAISPTSAKPSENPPKHTDPEEFLRIPVADNARVNFRKLLGEK